MADNVSAVEKALKDAKLFDDVRANFDAARQELDVEVHAGAKAPTRATVAKAIEDSGTKARLADVVWGASHYRT
jgi:hypothetical protein